MGNQQSFVSAGALVLHSGGGATSSDHGILAPLSNTRASGKAPMRTLLTQAMDAGSQQQEKVGIWP